MIETEKWNRVVGFDWAFICISVLLVVELINRTVTEQSWLGVSDFIL
jgi:hypothetical protein